MDPLFPKREYQALSITEKWKDEEMGPDLPIQSRLQPSWPSPIFVSSLPGRWDGTQFWFSVVPNDQELPGWSGLVLGLKFPNDFMCEVKEEGQVAVSLTVTSREFPTFFFLTIAASEVTVKREK